MTEFDPKRTSTFGMKRLSIEQCDGSGPARRSAFHLVGKAGNGEAVSRELFEVTKLFHVTVGNFASGLVSLPDNRRVDTRWTGANAAEARRHAAEISCGR